MPHRYLVTGCAGFIAAKVTELLLEAGHSVAGVDSLNDAYDPRLKHWRLDRLRPRRGFRFYQLDISDPAALESVFHQETDGARTQQARSAPFDAVVNLAARAGVRPSVENPWVYVEANVQGTLNLLDLCRRRGIGKFVLASTSSLYGAQNPVPYREDADTSRPLSPYAASKKAAEVIAYTYHHLHQIDVTVFRYFTVYGPAGRPDMSVFRFVRRIAEGEPIVVFGDGNQERDFTYVDDIARGTVAGLVPLGYEVINLGGDRPVKLSAVIDQISQITGREPVIQYRPAHPADVRATWADIQKAQKLLGWSPHVPIEEGLRRSIDWYRRHRNAVLPLVLGDR